MSSVPLFSIITVCRNCRHDLEITLESVAAQDWTDYEHVVADGASDDGSIELLTSRDSTRLRFISEPDCGIYDAMNKGMSMAKGKYLIFLNAGDRFHTRQVLSDFARAIAENDSPGIVYGQTDIVAADGSFLRPRHLTAPQELTLQSFASGMLVCHQAMAVLKKISQPYNVRYRFSADYNWVIEALQHSKHNVLIPKVLIDFQEGGATRRNKLKSLAERFAIMSRHYGLLPTAIRHIGFAFRALKRKI